MAGGVEDKLAAARTRLILDKPFLGALALRLPMVQAKASWCPTTATDARKFYFNHDYIDALSLSQVQFVLAHEALHCALSHFRRREHRDKRRWDVACDYAVSPLLMGDGLEAPPGTLYERKFEGMTAEEIYPCIRDTDSEEPMDRHIYDEPADDNPPPPPADEPPAEPPPAGDGEEGGAGDGQGEGGESREEEQGAGGGGAPQPPPLDAQERDALAVQWQQRLAGAAQQAMQAGKLGGDMARLVDHLLQPQLPWRMLLARYVTASARDDYSYSRPSSRRGGDAIMPSLRSAQVDMVVAVDTSGSISDEEIAQFMSEVDAIKGQVRARLTLLPCDTVLAEGAPWCFEPWEPADMPESVSGRGGTDFKPVFEWVEQAGRRPDLLVYFTDARGLFPRAAPDYPTIWLVKGREKVPWGQRVQLN
ncbi:MAG: VWA-like domain-containing protein [Gammaproteobacteria bacterium]|nr:VWA-like domain-containing protein [Gammaproteobacteria bacterium]